MPILENLPSIPSSKFSDEDINLFDKYRDDYGRTAAKIKSILDETKRTIEYDRVYDGFKSDGGLDKYAINCMSTWNIYTYDYFTAVPDNDEIHQARYFRILSDSVPFDSYSYFITAFYIPENTKDFRVYLKFPRKPVGSSRNDGGTKVLIGRYKRPSDKENSLGCWDQDLENILQRSKDFSFLNKGDNDLENILSDSKKRLVLKNECGKETVIFWGRKYKRLELIQPALYLADLYSTSIVVKISGENTDPGSVFLYYIDVNSLRPSRMRELNKGPNIYIGKIKDKYILYQIKDRKFIKLS